MKSYVKIALVALIILIIGLIIYFVWSALATPAPETFVPAPISSELPTIPSSGGNNGTSTQDQASGRTIRAGSHKNFRKPCF